MLSRLGFGFVHVCGGGRCGGGAWLSRGDDVAAVARWWSHASADVLATVEDALVARSRHRVVVTALSSSSLAAWRDGTTATAAFRVFRLLTLL